MVNEQIVSRLVMLYPDGTLDPTFMPGVSALVSAVVVEGTQSVFI